MSQATSIKELLVKLMDVRESTIITGTVTSADPLEIQADNDSQLTIDEDNCFLPEHLTDHAVNISIPHIGTERCTVHSALKKGERVYMLQYERGALYFVIDREGD